MKMILKIFFSLVTLTLVSWFVFLYFLLREAPPIKEYVFKEISALELEKRIAKEIEKEGYIFNIRDTVLSENDNIEENRYVILGEDSVRFYFKTQYDYVKSINKLSKNYIELNFISLKHPDIIGNYSYQFNTYKDIYGLHKIFEEEFLNKLGEWKEKKWWQFWW